jgi:hypothetical protein
MNKLEDFILVSENIIPHKLCDDILNEYKDSNEWEDSQIGVKEGVKTVKEIRNCTYIGLSLNTVIEKNKNVRKNLDDKVFKSTEEAIKQYNKKFGYVKVSKDSGYLLLKYKKGGFYKQHIDSDTTIPRIISCSFILNNNFKGGEFSFFNNNLTYPLKKGSAIMFPSNFLYPHSVLPVTSGTRYSIVTWFI